ncbi:oxidoreductase [Georgenia thermotolerans]|uniref:Oxidoreductase n=1 Tax=Georgenia thermotolerans TaxID=527326 RepID=A0A7J5UNZ0_9MICO|nr:oxidoreductase [Georgenia thermotolerans]KAE8764057.1 oxidoreductase [Georgenia thermotolerans]
MRLFSRRRVRPDPSAGREARARTLAHFHEFVATRVGVEAYLEPPTAHDPHTVVLVARSGEWTRRRVPDVRAARALAAELGIPIYDVHLTGYPASMRRWSSANRRR